MFSMFYTKPGETLQSNKVYDRPLALVLSTKAYNHFVDYTTEKYRMAALADKEVKRLEEVKEATYEVSKTWNNTIANIKKQRDEELVAKSRKEEEQRVQFVEDMAARKAAEHAEVIKEARKLLLSKKPDCRRINSALFTSECFKELDAQLRFQKTVKDFDKKRDMEYVEMMMKDIERQEENERKKNKEQALKERIYTNELKRQLQKHQSDLKREEEEKMKEEKEELINISKELELKKKRDIEEAENKKKYLNELFLDALRKKKKSDLKKKRNEEYQERIIATYNKGKQQIERKLKDQIKKEREEKIRRSEYLAMKCAGAAELHAEEEDLMKKAAEEKEAAENEKREARRLYEEKLRTEMKKYRQEYTDSQEKQKKHEEDVKTWEISQRLKRAEYDQQVKVKNFEMERLRKQKMAKSIQREISLKEAEKRRLELLDDDSEEIKANIEKTNEEVLRYGEEIIKESENVRPLFPIIKAIEQFKKENGLMPQKIFAESNSPSKKKKYQKRRPVCNKSISEDQICYI